jgi:hypothetical protein
VRQREAERERGEETAYGVSEPEDEGKWGEEAVGVYFSGTEHVTVEHRFIQWKTKAAVDSTG